MIGEEVRQHRGIKQISFAAIALLLSLTVVALYQRSQAEAQRTIGRPAPPNPAMNSRRRIFDPSRWISEPYHNYGCRERWFALVPMFAALRKSASGPVLKSLKLLRISAFWGGPEDPGGGSIRRE